MIGYPTPGKDKARTILQAFCAGAPGGEVAEVIPQRLAPGAAAFYGVTPATKHLFDQARAERRDWYYIDNAYFDPCREQYFRVTRGHLQHWGFGSSDGTRFRALGVDIKPWRAAGQHVVICPQSDEFMRVCAGYVGSWLEDTLKDLRRHTERELRVRPWNGNKREWYRTLPADLDDCWALVTYSSASAITALLSGVPAFATAKDCISRRVTKAKLANIELPRRPLDREAWAHVVADQQWTLAEMASGLTWKMLHA